MTLVPLTGVAEVVSGIAKNDPETARIFAEMGLFEVLGDMIDYYRPTIDGVVTKGMADRADDARRELVRLYVDRRLVGQDVTDVLQVAKALDTLEEGISKSWQESQHTRDPLTGRWVATLRGAKNPDQAADNAATQLQQWKQQGFVRPGDQVVVRTKQGGQIAHQVQSGHIQDRQMILSYGHASTVEAQPGQHVPAEGIQRHAFDAMSSFTGGDTASAAASKMPGQTQLASAATDWARPSTDGDRAAYRRMQVGGRALSAVSTPGSGPSAAGAVAQLAGHLGPEAENILGPGFARIGYRYRGTEKTPDQSLLREVTIADRLSSGEAPLPDRNVMESPGVGAAMYHDSDASLSPDQKKLLVRGDAAVGYFAGKIPDPQLAELSIAANRVPPSQGAIINSEGHVTTEAVGVGEDHYLPFDLKNLKSLHGGQYVRTRLAGGLTSEDIYTGLMTGTRQIQVVSNSGVFTMEFDPTLRGGRRYSDKARAMVSRYQQMLDAIGTNKVDENPIPPKRMNEMRSEANRLFPNSPKEANTHLHTLITQESDRALFGAEVSEEEMKAQAHATAAKDAPAGSSDQAVGRLADAEFERLTNEAKDTQARKLRLDGVGYGRAMAALKQEFPYFIRSVGVEPLKDFHDTRGVKAPRPPKRTPPRPGLRATEKNRVLPGRVDTKGRKLGNASAWKDKKTEAPEEAPSAGGSAPTSAGAGARDTTAIAVPHKPGVTTLDKVNKTAVYRDASDALSKIEQAAIQSPAGATPSQSDLADVAASTNLDAPSLARALLTEGSRFKIGNETLQGGPRLLGENFGKLPPKKQSEVIAGLKQMDTDLTSVAEASGDQAYRSLATPDDFKKAIEALQKVSLVEKPFSEPQDKPHLYKPSDEGAAPQRFADVHGLGDDMDSYSAFESGASSNPDLKTAITAMAAMSPEDRRKHVVEQVSKFEAIEAASKKPHGAPVYDHYATSEGVTSPEEAAAWLKDGTKERQLHALQKAWSFSNAKDIATTITGGGASPKEPKAEEHKAGLAPPQFQSPVGKRLPGPRKLIIHPPGSAVSKVLRGLRSTR